MTRVCLLLFVFLAATRLQAQYTHNKVYTIDEACQSKFDLALYNVLTKKYLYIDGDGVAKFQSTTEWGNYFWKLSSGAYLYKRQKNIFYTWSMDCCYGPYNEVSVTAGPNNDDIWLEEVKDKKNVYRIKFAHNGLWLTSTGAGHKVYGSTEYLGDEQHWMIVGHY